LKDQQAAEILEKLDDAETRTVIIAERALMAALGGGCSVPLGAWARMERGELVLEAMLCSADGAQYVRQIATAPSEQATELGQRMAHLLMEGGAGKILEEVRRSRG